MIVTGAGSLVRAKSAPWVIPVTLPIAVKVPALVFALMAIVALPFTSVLAVLAVLVAKVPLALVPRTLNVTVLLETGFPNWSVTVATKLFAKLVATTVL